jgi:hypothetical protein
LKRRHAGGAKPAPSQAPPAGFCAAGGWLGGYGERGLVGGPRGSLGDLPGHLGRQGLPPSNATRGGNAAAVRPGGDASFKSRGAHQAPAPAAGPGARNGLQPVGGGVRSAAPSGGAADSYIGDGIGE